ncbi:hypothetical protein GUJ93_ZPchr0002g25276 [Zizania palustris]|uniref:Uncharacterized protein n=1 Tax=Zizania palustris TaxID=103762 RepID=A0A8J5RX42_ZIZPA|nr:hypothetical protein GUJ93_ZPchr0002g25276 [Zizania palustris]
MLIWHSPPLSSSLISATTGSIKTALAFANPPLAEADAERLTLSPPPFHPTTPRIFFPRRRALPPSAGMESGLVASHRLRLPSVAARAPAQLLRRSRVAVSAAATALRLPRHLPTPTPLRLPRHLPTPNALRLPAALPLRPCPPAPPRRVVRVRAGAGGGGVR